MVIRTNAASLCAYREYKKTARATAKNLEKLSSGYRINRSADDASGLSASERMRANITELDRCENNALEGLKLAKTADGALAEINDMLRRARELCIQAENGTYSEQELASISDEMNQLFSEIDRITEGSFFNEIQLFRGDVGPDFHYEYDETFSPVDNGPIEWGTADFVQAKPFDPAEPAKPATIKFTLNSDIDLDDPKTLNGCTIRIRSGYGSTYTYCFTDGTSPLPSGTYAISLSGVSTIEQGLARVANEISCSMQFDRSTRTVTFTAPLHTLNYNVNGLGYAAANGNGSWANGQYTLSSLSGSASLDQVDGSNATNNQPVYDHTIHGTFNMSHLNRTLTTDDINNLQGNTLKVAGYSIPLKDIVRNGMTGDDLGAALATKISTFSNLTASYDNGTHTLSIKYNLSGTLAALTMVEDTTKSTGGGDAEYDYPEGNKWTSGKINFAVTQTQAPSQERPEVCEITIPSIPSGPFSFKIGSYTYLYYNSDNNPLTHDEFDLTKYSSTPDYIINTKNMNSDQIVADIANRIRSRFSSYGVVVNGNKLTVTGTQADTSMNLSSRFSDFVVTVTPYRKRETKPASPVIPGTDPVLRPSLGSNYNYTQGVQVPFTLPAEGSLTDLAGSGFSIKEGYYGSTIRYEFVNGSGTGKSSNYTDIDISGCSTYDELRAAVQSAMGNRYTITIDGNKLLMCRTITNGTAGYYGDSVTVTDGLTGTRSLMEESSVSASGGTDIGHSQAAIDFSSIHSSNLNDLLGKGFRVTCATCPDEYINVFFCWENNGRAPASFDIVGSDGATRTIHNIAVELSKVASGDQIVQSIVDQVRPTLKHFTDVDVGSSSTTLLAQDKRRGDYIAEVLSGLNANFTYSVNIRKVEDYPADGSVVQKNNNVEIYVGSEPNPQIIPIHLPYLDLKTLRLRPPETVDLNADDQDASDWLNRVDRANLFISESRGVIGADHNRLEHAVKQLSSAHVDLADAESRIRDTDMAEEMMEHVKLQILTQAQQGMLAQANSRPQQILQLIS